jgi:protein-L-isoaspartate(D-aspartate) O-methyltransferase
MIDTAAARRLMVEGQVRTADVSNAALLDAMMTIPRERFLPPAQAPLAYADIDVPIGNSRALLKPMVLAKLIQAAGVRDTDHVLDVACGTGYSSAVLARLAGSVIALEEDAELARQAKEALASTRTERVTLAVGPLIAGWPAAAPYDVILINGAIEVVSPALAHQLKPDGRLACVYGRPPAGKATIYRVIEGRPVGRSAFDAAAPLLQDFVAPPAFVF